MPTLSWPLRPALLISFCGLLCSQAHAGTPDWVLKRPILPRYYVGIGVSQKNKAPAEYTESAREVALNDIASQITVSISSDVLRRVFETHESLGEEFESRIRASAKADIEGVELVDTYENDDEYWVYYRLSKADYDTRRAAKMKNAAMMSLDHYAHAQQFESKGDLARALGQYALALGPIEKYLSEPLQVDYNGRSVFLVNEIYTSLQGVLGRIELKTDDGKRSVKFGRPIRPPLRVSAEQSPGAIPVAHLPLSFTFIRGSGDLVGRVRTDENGQALCDIHKVTASQTIQVVEARVDLHALIERDSVPPVIETIVGSLKPPAVRFVLTVSGVDVAVEADESMFGQKLEQNRIEPVLKEQLGEKGFAFVADPSKAQLILRIKAEARRGAQTYGLAFAFVSATISVLDLETGQEIFKSSVEDVKEGSDSYEKAALKAFSTAARRVSGDLLPRLVEHLQH